ncbi:hypothetical protein [Saccharothrix obliqua]|uniref:hypothetical protein n=1 Tax=Saccharothrix obliqua TaxID=2861747 RepID=UPI001C60709F|nr:hypothetical protein [Saccharothrix obliqua]MBW4716762.1 hypothetical protein [Saccharothrix obliqua]
MSWWRRSLHTALCGLLLGGLVLVAGQPASAMSGSGPKVVNSGFIHCVVGVATIDHWSPGVFSGNLGYADAYLYSRDLNGACTRPATGQGRARVDVQVWTDSGWSHCRGSDWAYGAFGWTGGELGGPYGPKKILDYGGSASCGAGYYRAVATVEHDNNGGWVGGSVNSPYEWVD